MISTGLNHHFWGVSHGGLSIRQIRMDMYIKLMNMMLMLDTA